jgi:endonuclease-8
MAEGPQVRRRAEWLHANLNNRRVLSAESSRPALDAALLTGKLVKGAFCKGKHIFIEFEGGVFVHNHLLMRGTWRKREGRLLFLLPDAWLALYLGRFTVYNLRGQMLKIVGRSEVDHNLESLGPDAMAKPYPAEAISKAFRSERVPIAEALLQQSLVAGVGNIGKSEVLYSARINPQARASELDNHQLSRLHRALQDVLWASYDHGGRWNCHVYRHMGKPCRRCGARIRTLRCPPSKRTTYYCPQCQG